MTVALHSHPQPRVRRHWHRWDLGTATIRPATWVDGKTGEMFRGKVTSLVRTCRSADCGARKIQDRWPAGRRVGVRR